MTDQPPNNQTLSIRISKALLHRLESLRDLTTARTGQSVSLSEVARQLLESSPERLDVADLLQEPTETLLRLRYKYEAHQPLSRAEWIVLAYFVSQGAEAFPHSPLPRASWIALLEAFQAVYPLRHTVSAARDAYYLGNLPRPGRPAESSLPITPETVRQTVGETVQGLKASACAWRPLLAARNLYVFLADEDRVGAEAISQRLWPFWPALWKIAARGHYARRRTPVPDRDRPLEDRFQPPIPPLIEGRFSLTLVRAEGNELYLRLDFPFPAPLGSLYPITTYPMIADFRALLDGLTVETPSWKGTYFQGYVREREGAPAFWFRAHANAITFGFSEADWKVLQTLFRRAWAMPDVQAAWNTLSLQYGEL